MTLKIALCASAAVLLLAACGEPAADDGALSVETEAAGDGQTVSPAAPAAAQDAWYAIIPFEVAPENRARVAELSGTTVAPAQAAIGREMLQFFPTGDDTGGYLILGRFDSAEDALAHSNPGQDQEFLAAYQAHMGDAGGAATQETMSMMTPGPAIVAHRSVSTPPVADGGAAPVYYIVHAEAYSEDTRIRRAVSVFLNRQAYLRGGEVFEFEFDDPAPWVTLTFYGRYESAEAANDRVTMINSETTINELWTNHLDPEALRAEYRRAASNDLGVVYRHPPE